MNKNGPFSLEEYAHLLFESMPLGVVYQNADGEILTANPAAQKILGLSLDQLQGRTSLDPCWRSIHEDGSEFPGEEHPAMHALRTGEPVRGVVMGVFNPQTESINWISINSSPYCSQPGGTPTLVFTTFEDITARKRAEQDLRESESRYRLISENAADVIWVLDPLAVKFTYVSPSVEKLRGYTPAEVMSQPVSDALTPESYKLVSESLAATLPAFIARGSGTMTFINEVDQPHKDGSIVHTEVTTTYLFNEKGQVEIVGVTRDITARKQAEQEQKEMHAKLETLFEILPVGISVLDHDNRVVKHNPELQKILGLTTEGLVRGDYRQRRYIHPDGTPILSHEFASARVINGEASALDVEAGVVKEDGDVVWVNVSAVAVPFSDWKAVIATTDMTGRKKMELALRESEEKFASLFYKAAIPAVFVSLPERVAVDVNFAFEKLSGYSRQETIGKNPVELGVLDPAEAQRIFAEPPQPGSWAGIEGQLITRSGERRSIMIHANELEVGERKYAIVTSQDITERRRAEDELSASRATLNTLLENIDARIWAVDREYRLIHSNSRFDQYFSGVLGTKFEVGECLLRANFPAELNEQWRGYYDRALGGESFFVETTTVLKQPARHVEYAIHPIVLTDGQIQGATVFERDITQRKEMENALRQSEEKFSTLFENAAIPSVLVELPGHVAVNVNRAFETMSGYDRQEVIGRNPVEIGITRSGMPTLLSTYQGQKRVVDTDAEFIRKSGKVAVVIISFNAIEINARNYAILTFQDITERKEAEEKLLVSHAQLSELSRQLVKVQEEERRMVGRELHDQIGQMLTAVKVTLEIARQLPSNVALKKVDHAQEIVTDLLDRVSQLSLDLRPPMLDDLGLIPALIWHINRYQEQSSIKVTFKHAALEDHRLRPELETTVYRIIQEALTNVARHAQAQHIHLELLADGSQMQLHIKDDGKGFDPDVALSKNRGLSGMRERAKLLGGSLLIDSSDGRGTQIRVWLPLQETSA